MAKVIVLFDEPVDKEGFDRHYYGVHVPLVNEIPNLKAALQSRVALRVNTDEDVYMIAELEFVDTVSLHQALASDAGKAVQADVQKLLPFLPKAPVMYFTE